jgi:cycloartenol synthase
MRLRVAVCAPRHGVASWSGSHRASDASRRCVAGWPISDCTAEGLKAALRVRESGALPADFPLIPDARLHDAANIILSYQNKDGGWATYENTRGGEWWEWLNPSEVRPACARCRSVSGLLGLSRCQPCAAAVRCPLPCQVFGDIMIDYSYVECTSACVTALAAFRKHFPEVRRREVDQSIRRGAAYIRKYQRADGSCRACRWCCIARGVSSSIL